MFYIQRINNRILVFVVPIEFVAVQPIEWLCTCLDNGIFIVELVNDVKSIELANQRNFGSGLPCTIQRNVAVEFTVNG